MQDESEPPARPKRRDRWRELVEASTAEQPPQTNPGRPRKKSLGDQSKHGYLTLTELPLFASDEDIAGALMGPGKGRVFRAIVPLLERRGFPKYDGLMGGRYVPAVKAFFDREYDVSGPAQVSAPHVPARLGASWKKQATDRRG
jgi:hypothetical protein